MKTRIELRLYISDDSRLGHEALTNLKTACNSPEIRRHYDIDIDVVDIDERPQLAEDDKILVTPTLIKKLPEPARRQHGQYRGHLHCPRYSRWRRQERQ